MTARKCLGCPHLTYCPHFLPGARCIYNLPVEARAIEARKLLRRYHLVRTVGAGVAMLWLGLAVGLRFA